MGRQQRGIYPGESGTWQIDKYWRGTRLRQRGFTSAGEAESWLIRQLEQLRAVAIHGTRPSRTFEQAAAHYLSKYQDKASIESEIDLLQSVMPFIGHLQLHQVHDAPLKPTSRSDWPKVERTRP